MSAPYNSQCHPHPHEQHHRKQHASHREHSKNGIQIIFDYLMPPRLARFVPVRRGVSFARVSTSTTCIASEYLATPWVRQSCRYAACYATIPSIHGTSTSSAALRLLAASSILTSISCSLGSAAAPTTTTAAASAAASLTSRTAYYRGELGSRARSVWLALRP